MESRPFAAVCYCNRAAAYKVLGQITEAIADCSLAIALDGNYLKVSLFNWNFFFIIIESDGVKCMYDKDPLGKIVAHEKYRGKEWVS